jgi:hypothetical protein
VTQRLDGNTANPPLKGRLEIGPVTTKCHDFGNLGNPWSAFDNRRSIGLTTCEDWTGSLTTATKICVDELWFNRRVKRPVGKSIQDVLDGRTCLRLESQHIKCESLNDIVLAENIQAR